MIIFIDEDRPYRHWVTHHRQGFVLDGCYKPKWSHLVLHRAECPQVEETSSKRSHWTTGSRFKACALQRDELVEWVEERLALCCARCPECSPDTGRSNDSPARDHLTPLSAAILEYLLEAASLHFDDESPPYRLTVGMIAAYLGKSPGQVSGALHRLREQGRVDFSRVVSPGKPFRESTIVYPTAVALQTLPEFTDCSAQIVAAELAKLHVSQITPPNSRHRSVA